MTEDTHYTNDFLDAFQSWLDTTEINLCDISIKEALQSAFEAGHDYCAEHNRYLKEALIVEQQKVNKMKVCGNCKHYIRPYEDSYVGEEECRFNISESGCDSCDKWELAE